MPSDEELARSAMEHQKQAREVSLTQIPLYVDWSKRKLAEGESPAFIASLDATPIWATPDEAITEEELEEMLQGVKDACENLE